MNNIEKPTAENSALSHEVISEPLTGREGIDMMRELTSQTDGVNLEGFLKTPEGQEALKCKKIVLAGPPRSGKSCARQGLKDVITSMPNAPYPYFVTACPDGEGSWFQESMNANPEMAAQLKKEYKSAFTPEFTKRIADSVHNLSARHNPLNFIDIGGIISKENHQICSGANMAIIISGENALKEGSPIKWKEFFTELGIPLIAEVYSDYASGKDGVDIVDGVDENGVFRGSVHYLERGEPLKDRECIQELAQYIVELGEKEVLRDSDA